MSDIVPLYDRVKNQIYDEFQRVKRQATTVERARGSRKRVLALRTFRAKYKRFFFEIYALQGFERMPVKIRRGLMFYAENSNTIRGIEKVDKTLLLCTLAIRELKINKITFDKDDETF